MNIDFKKPRYAIPLILLPFIVIFFYVYKSSFGKESLEVSGKDSLQSNLAEVSDQIRNKSLSDKLEAYRNAYRQPDGYTAIGALLDEQDSINKPNTLYNEKERQMLDSIDKAIKGHYGAEKRYDFPDALRSAQEQNAGIQQDREMAQAIEMLHRQQNAVGKREQEDRHRDTDPMELFRKQMELVDSMGKANDPEYQKKLRKSEDFEQRESKNEPQKRLTVRKPTNASAMFNTVSPYRKQSFITAIVDQDIKGYTGSRLRIRLLEDLMVGTFLIQKGTYLFAQITGFTGQRVALSILSILNGDQILPVRLDIYDNDGIPGLYVPASAFREFTKDLGDNASQGLTLQQAAENNSEMVMSMVQKMFQSTSTAVSKLIRQNRAKLKYGTIIYLIDPEQLRSNQNSNFK